MTHTPNKNPDGYWLPSYKVDPRTNIYGRAYRCENGDEGVYHPAIRLQSPVNYWYFPSPQNSEEGRPQ